VSFRRLHRRILLVVALLAVTLAALAPAISHALAAVSGSRAWVEVCTAQGSRWVQLDRTSSTQPMGPVDAAGGALEHCPCCHLGHLGMAPPPAGPMFMRGAAMRDGPPARFLSAPRSAPVWRAAQPRGPPSFS
jgi:hypothetical protein